MTAGLPMHRFAIFSIIFIILHFLFIFIFEIVLREEFKDGFQFFKGKIKGRFKRFFLD